MMDEVPHKQRMVRFTVPGKPVGKGRPRFTRSGHTYTPAQTAAYEQLVVLYSPRGVRFAGPVAVEVRAVFEPPRSCTKKMRAQLVSASAPYAHKPDADNIGKIICDALNGVLWRDDAQVSELRVVKIYGEQNRTEVCVKGVSAE